MIRIIIVIILAGSAATLFANMNCYISDSPLGALILLCLYGLLSLPWSVIISLLLIFRIIDA